ncbi:MAG: hypothetical protein EBU57_01330 [Alphaproteobacteria bacterium]|nr:hypothetical protein [Alphaproteobacteria bacterium]
MFSKDKADREWCRRSVECGRNIRCPPGMSTGYGAMFSSLTCRPWRCRRGATSGLRAGEKVR